MINWFKNFIRHNNEYYLAALFFVLTLTFPMWIVPIVKWFYPNVHADTIGSSSPGIYENLVLGSLIFFYSLSITWLWFKVSIPKLGRWFDDSMPQQFIEGDDWKVIAKAALMVLYFIAIFWACVYIFTALTAYF